jgi:hypothetical protein
MLSPASRAFRRDELSPGLFAATKPRQFIETIASFVI